MLLPITGSGFSVLGTGDDFSWQDKPRCEIKLLIRISVSVKKKEKKNPLGKSYVCTRRWGGSVVLNWRARMRWNIKLHMPKGELPNVTVFQRFAHCCDTRDTRSLLSIKKHVPRKRDPSSYAWEPLAKTLADSRASPTDFRSWFSLTNRLRENKRLPHNCSISFYLSLVRTARLHRTGRAVHESRAPDTVVQLIRMQGCIRGYVNTSESRHFGISTFPPGGSTNVCIRGTGNGRAAALAAPAGWIIWEHLIWKRAPCSLRIPTPVATYFVQLLWLTAISTRVDGFLGFRPVWPRPAMFAGYTEHLYVRIERAAYATGGHGLVGTDRWANGGTRVRGDSIFTGAERRKGSVLTDKIFSRWQAMHAFGKELSPPPRRRTR